jgi:hypothetical protein
MERLVARHRGAALAGLHRASVTVLFHFYDGARIVGSWRGRKREAQGEYLWSNQSHAHCWTIDFMSAMHRIRAGGSGHIAYQRDMMARFDIDAARALIRDSLSTPLDRRRWRDGTGSMQSIVGRKGHQAE